MDIVPLQIVNFTADDPTLTNASAVDCTLTFSEPVRWEVSLKQQEDLYYG